MNKTEFEKELEILKNKKAIINNKIAELNTSYIKSNVEFKKGDKVEIINRKNEKIIVHYYSSFVKYNNKIEHVFFKSKKDGGRSKVEYPWYDIIEIIRKVE